MPLMSAYSVPDTVQRALWHYLSDFLNQTLRWVRHDPHLTDEEIEVPRN